MRSAFSMPLNPQSAAVEGQFTKLPRRHLVTIVFVARNNYLLQETTCGFRGIVNRASAIYYLQSWASRADTMIRFRANSRKKSKPRVPKGVRIYAIGDIHGRADLLDEVLERIDADLATNPVGLSIDVFLGDYIDRGPASQRSARPSGGAQAHISGGFSQGQP